MSKVIAIANQKGGVGKTSTAVNLGIGLVNEGKRVLLIDCDAQGNLTESLGFRDPDNMDITLSTAVSYTHLDVYKRQSLSMAAGGRSFLRCTTAGIC